MHLYVYELKKLWKRKLLLASALILLVFNASLLVLPYAKDTYANGELNHVISLYEEAFTNKVSKKTLYQIDAYANKVQNHEVETVEEDGSGDLIALEMIKEKVESILSYQQEVMDKAEISKENVAYFSRIEDEIKMKENSKLKNLFENRNLDLFSRCKGWEVLLQHQQSNIFLLLLVFFVIPCIWNREKEEDMLVMIYSTSKGYKHTLLAKVLAAISVMSILLLAFSLSECIICMLLYGTDGWNAPLYLSELYRDAMINMSFLSFWLFTILCKFFVFSFCTLLVLFLTKLSKTAVHGAIISGFVLSGLMLLAELYPSFLNPLSPLYTYVNINTHEMISLMQLPLFTYEISIIVCIIFTAVAFLLNVMKNRRICL